MQNNGTHTQKIISSREYVSIIGAVSHAIDNLTHISFATAFRSNGIPSGTKLFPVKAPWRVYLSTKWCQKGGDRRERKACPAERNL
jgi:hypothetical protein